MFNNAIAQINTEYLYHNVNIIKRMLDENTRLCAVVKANAYGHGATAISILLEKYGVDHFAVANGNEALELRKCGIKSDILILGYAGFSEIPELADNNITISVPSYDYAEKVNSILKKNDLIIKGHIKLDTGMGRIGFPCRCDQNNELINIEKSIKLKNIDYEGIFTHFACSGMGTDGKSFTESQYKYFSDMILSLNKDGIDFDLKHCSNSSAIADYPNMQCDMVRSGAFLYGFLPSEEIKNKPEIKQIMKLYTYVTQVKTIHKNDPVGYGCTYIAAKNTKIATLPVGYCDIFCRANNINGCCVSINGASVPIIGRVCMDQMMVDVTDIDCKEGDIVTIFDDNYPCRPSDFAFNNNTNTYEIYSTVGNRVERKYI